MQHACIEIFTIKGLLQYSLTKSNRNINTMSNHPGQLHRGLKGYALFKGPKYVALDIYIYIYIYMINVKNHSCRIRSCSATLWWTHAHYMWSTIHEILKLPSDLFIGLISHGVYYNRQYDKIFMLTTNSCFSGQGPRDLLLLYSETMEYPISKISSIAENLSMSRCHRDLRFLEYSNWNRPVIKLSFLERVIYTRPTKHIMWYHKK